MVWSRTLDEDPGGHCRVSSGTVDNINVREIIIASPPAMDVTNDHKSAVASCETARKRQHRQPTQYNTTQNLERQTLDKITVSSSEGPFGRLQPSVSDNHAASRSMEHAVYWPCDSAPLAPHRVVQDDAIRVELRVLQLPEVDVRLLQVTPRKSPEAY